MCICKCIFLLWQIEENETVEINKITPLKHKVIILYMSLNASFLLIALIPKPLFITDSLLRHNRWQEITHDWHKFMVTDHNVH